MAQIPRFAQIRVVLSIAVLAIAVLVFVQYQSSALSAEEAGLRSQLFQLREALDEYQADRGTCPESLSQLVEGKYIRAIPIDPATKSSTTWTFTQARTDRGRVCDVKSASPKVARDGSRYAAW